MLNSRSPGTFLSEVEIISVIIVQNSISIGKKVCLGVLLAIRELSQASTDFSPDELMLMDAQFWVCKSHLGELKNAEPPVIVLNYVNDFCGRLHIACATAYKNLSCAQEA